MLRSSSTNVMFSPFKAAHGIMHDLSQANRRGGADLYILNWDRSSLGQFNAVQWSVIPCSKKLIIPAGGTNKQIKYCFN